MNDVTSLLRDFGIIPVVVLDEPGDALSLGRALLAGGLPVAEITFRTSAAKESIRILADELPELLVGAGTVLTAEQAATAISAGAKFLVTPGMNEAVIEFGRERNVPVYPGTGNATDVERAAVLGLSTVKFFPAEASGGLETLRALSGPFPEMRFIPTGGISPTNLRAYLDQPRVLAAGGSWLVDRKAIRSGDYDRIRRLTAEAIGTVMGYSIAHVGINCDSPEAASDLTDSLSAAFALSPSDLGNVYFSGSLFELLKEPGRGEKGHIAVETADIQRSIAFLKRNGFALPDENLIYQDGVLRAAYLEREFGGFAIHLLRRL